MVSLINHIACTERRIIICKTSKQDPGRPRRRVKEHKGYVVRDTFLRLVKFLKKIRDRLLHGIDFMSILDTLTLKLL